VVAEVEATLRREASLLRGRTRLYVLAALVPPKARGLRAMSVLNIILVLVDFVGRFVSNNLLTT
jgi:hypothetical protein